MLQLRSLTRLVEALLTLDDARSDRGRSSTILLALVLYVAHVLYSAHVYVHL